MDDTPNNDSPVRTTIISRWEALLSIAMFGIISAIHQGIIPEGKPTRYAVWFIALISQIGIVFGRPLLIRGIKQNVNLPSVVSDATGKHSVYNDKSETGK